MPFKRAGFVALMIVNSLCWSGENLIEGKKANGDFPWDLVLDRGKIYGCLYENLFFSPGAIHLEEGLPRKCRIDSNRDGYWADLDERELELYELALSENYEAMEIGGTALSREEIAVISFMRKIAAKGALGVNQ